MRRPYYRTSRGRVIAGVCAGLAERYGRSPDTIRWWYAVAQLFSLPAIATYILQWLLYPLDDNPEPPAPEQAAG